MNFFHKKGKVVLNIPKGHLTDQAGLKAFFPTGIKILSVRTNKANLVYRIAQTNKQTLINSKTYFLFDKNDPAQNIHRADLVELDFLCGRRFAEKKFDIDDLFGVLAILITALFIGTGIYRFEKKDKHRAMLFLGLGLVFIASYITYFDRYQYPSSMFWDENYYITSVEKYKNNIMFMSGHFLLAKQILTLGELLLSPNEGLTAKNAFTKGHIKKLPPSYSFVGVRFFPVLCAVLIAILLYFIFYYIFYKPLYAALFSMLYIMENAFVVHFRGAMLDSIELFFIAALILVFIKAVRNCRKQVPKRTYFYMGLLAGASVSSKENGAIVFLFFLFLIVYEYRHALLRLRLSLQIIKNTAWKTVISITGILLVFCGSWYVHFAAGTRIYQNKTYKASPAYLEIIKKGETANPLHFPIMLRDNLAFIKNYHKGVPHYDPCKEGENGSLPIHWLIGKKSINYAWAKRGGKARYRYLQVNPLTWAIGLAAIILSLMLIGSVFLFRLPLKNKTLFFLITVLAASYLSYMIVVINADRVLYLYHYFIPQLFNIMLAGLVFCYCYEEYIIKDDKLLAGITVFIGVLILLVFLYFSPFCYNLGLTTEQFLNREWFDVWGLEYI
ncbi:MAG TPA: phospholipid carrier-dependent glycosyltransferase [Spirochaetota bacterium]|nr:phospholipid carrier-dependent glycosyltransferase [Spirochaetota bacterium]